MARRSKRKNGGKRFTIPLAVVAGFVPLATWTYDQVKAGGIKRFGWAVTEALTGYDTDTNKWWAPNLRKGLLPILLGMTAHMIAGKVGINRALGRMGLPYVRI